MVFKAVCFGEVLWDIFLQEERIGGAPLNVASRLSAAGINTEMISRVGRDEKGNRIASYLEEKNVGIANLGIDPDHPTGMVQVMLDSEGSATYEISYPSAWDKIELKNQMVETVKQANAFIFGSLVCRDTVSRNTLFELVKHSRNSVFDINLRPPHYELEVLKNLMQEADFIKFNEEELMEIASALGSSSTSLEHNLNYIAEKTKTSSICVTRGSEGAALLHNGKIYASTGFSVTVKDTVGAGDSFLACLIAALLQNKDPEEALTYACAVGAMVAGREGANPELDEDEIKEFMGRSGL